MSTANNVVPLFQQQNDSLESAPALTWAELVQQNPHLPEHLRLSLEAALKGLVQWEQHPDSRTAYIADACLGNLARELVPMHRRESITRERTAEFSAPYVQARELKNAQNRAKKAAAAKARRKGKAGTILMHEDEDTDDDE